MVLKDILTNKERRNISNKGEVNFYLPINELTVAELLELSKFIDCNHNTHIKEVDVLIELKYREKRFELHT